MAGSRIHQRQLYDSFPLKELNALPLFGRLSFGQPVVVGEADANTDGRKLSSITSRLMVFIYERWTAQISDEAFLNSRAAIRQLRKATPHNGVASELADIGEWRKANVSQFACAVAGRRGAGVV